VIRATDITRLYRQYGPLRQIEGLKRRRLPPWFRLWPSKRHGRLNELPPHA
jgi:hypothetical protein